MSDPGDEHMEPPPVPVVRDPIRELLEQWDLKRKPGEPSHEMDYWPMMFMVRAESMRDCCQACALDANGEDGS